MRRLCLLLLLAFGLPSLAAAQACTGLCLQQVACAPGNTTSISGTVYAPNHSDTDPMKPGDPLPNVLVFIPNAPLTAMTPGVTCPVPGTVPDGAPLVGTTTAADGTFRLDNVPVGTNIPLVIQSGRWRRQVTVPAITACANNAFSTRFPKNQIEGDIPQFAIATGAADQVECVLRKVGIDDAEFTNPLSTGRIHIYGDQIYTARDGTLSGGGAIIDSSTPLQSTLTNDLARLKKYDVLMLPCEGGEYERSGTSLKNLVAYADAGGRVYASHFSYVWMYQNPPLDSVVNWDVRQAGLADGLATVNPGFYGASTLTTWLQTVNASPTPGQIQLFTNRHDLDGVRPPTQAWITLNDPVHNNPVMQFTFDTPVGSTNQCGRVLFNEYHVENRAQGAPSSSGRQFPKECTDEAITPQEQLLEYSLFDLTNSGSQPTLTPTTADFGMAYVGFNAGPKNFTWTNHSIFTASVASATTTGDFAVVGNNCTAVVSGASCILQVIFKPTMLGAAAGTLVVISNGTKLTSNLTGNGVSALTITSTSLTFGNTDVGFPSAAQSLVLQNVAPGAIPLAGVIPSGDFAVTSNCGNSLAVGASCTVNVTFKPSTTGMRANQASFNGQAVTFAGNGVDFSTNFTPPGGGVIAGLATKASLAVLPLAGYSATVQLSCSTTAPGSTCTMSTASVVPSGGAVASVRITTTAKYGVIGYGVFGSWKSAIGSFLAGICILRRRRLISALCALCLATVAISGCGSKTPATNAVYTTPGIYSYTVTATDGQLVHTAVYSLTVTPK